MRSWLTGIAAAVILLWLALLSAVAVVRDDPSREPGFDFVPTDGSAERITVGPDAIPASREHALIRGNAIQFGAAAGALSQSSPPPGTRPEDAWWWRETTALAGPADDRARHTVHSISPDGVRLHAALGTEDGAVFSPGLLELPTAVAPGQSWTSEGTRTQAGGAWDYRNDSSAARPADGNLADAGCLEITSRTTVRPRAETPSDAIVPAPRSDVATWCPRRGVVQGTPTGGETVAKLEGAWPPDRMGQPRSAGPRDPAGLPQPLGAAATEPVFGSSPIPELGRDPSAVTRDGTLVSLTPATQGLAGSTIRTDPARGAELQARWWAKPPGNVLTLTAFDDIVLVTTSTRDVIAYESGGRRLWRRHTADLVLQPPRRLDRNRVVMTDAQGRVTALDDSGEISWTHQVSAQAAPLLTAADGEVYVSGGDGAVERLDSEGRPVWQATVDNAASAPLLVQPIGSIVLLGNGSGGFTELDRATGNWRRDYVAGNAHSFTELLPGGDRVALTSSRTGVQILDPQTRRVTGVIAGGRVALPINGGWLVATDDDLVRTDIGGVETGRQPLPRARPGDEVSMATSPGVLWLVHGGSAPGVEVVR